jgi:hypothetical protein
MNPSFYVIYPFSENVRIFINAIRVLAEENQRTQVHITVRGPYYKRLSQAKENEYSSIIKGEEIIVKGVANFFESNQNTVFFEFKENENLRKIWKKTTYLEYNPHITIYDGKDKAFAHELFDILKQDFKSFSFSVNEISWLEPKDKEKLELFHLKTVVDFENLSIILGKEIDLSKIGSLSNKERLSFISILSNKLYQ